MTSVSTRSEIAVEATREPVGRGDGGLAPNLWGMGKRLLRNAAYRMASVTYRLGPEAGDSILLTFDDGPHPEVTPRVLDRLDVYGAKALFFVVGNRIDRAPWALAEILRRGHQLGNHTYYHDYARRDFAEHLDDIGRCQNEVERLTGYRPTCFRAPLGKLSLASLRAARHLALQPIHWSVDGQDWLLHRDDAAEKRGRELASRLKGRDIVLLHDEKPTILSLIDVMLPELRDRGFGLCPEPVPFVGRVPGSETECACG